MNVISLYSGHQHVSATYVPIFRVERTRIKVKLNVKLILEQATKAQRGRCIALLIP
jgi:hypothetical protein